MDRSLPTRSFPAEEYRSRYERTLEALERRGLDVFLATTPEDIYWLTGYDSFGGYQFQAAVVRPDSQQPDLFIHEMEASYALEVAWCADVQTWSHGTDNSVAHDPVSELAGRLRFFASAGANVGVNSAGFSFSASIRDRLAEQLPRVRLVDAGDVVSELRVVKSAREIAWIRRAAAFSDLGVDAVIKIAAEGRSELELLTAVQTVLNAAGSEQPAMPHLILVGDRSVYGHQPPSTHRIEATDRIVVEVVGVAARYHANTSRTITVGRAAPLLADASAAVLEAVRRCTLEAGPGVRGADLDRLSRDLTRRFDRYRRHRVGYGLEASFPPAMTGRLSLSRGDDRVLVAGMVVALAPHLYFYDEPVGSRFAAVFGNDILITETGAETLTRTPLALFHAD